jgi:polysaccharide deacetylase family protein (PEP-CTERM system associated)
MNQSTNKPLINALTIDVEDYYMVSAFEDVIKFEDWHRYESRVERNTHKILDLLDEYQVKATFFVLGWIAEHYPNLVRDIHASGHEIACHGYNHRLIYHLTPDEFREDVRMAKSILEDTIGTQVIGYRAASYSIVKKTLWAIDILIEEGFLYDSSIFPVRHDRYGLPGAGRFPYAIKRNNGTIMEFPPSTYRIFNQNIPIAGGGYLRLYPLQITKALIKRINEREKKIAILYIHPWEIDVEQPRLNGRHISRIRHYINLNSTLPKLRYFLTKFRFGPLFKFLNSSSIPQVVTSGADAIAT